MKFLYSAASIASEVEVPDSKREKSDRRTSKTYSCMVKKKCYLVALTAPPDLKQNYR